MDSVPMREALLSINLNPKTDEVAFEFLPFFRAFKDGRVERFFGTDVVPAAASPQQVGTAGVCSKDVQIVPENKVSGRLFLPSSKIKPHQKLPLLIYIHGGAFCFGSPFCAAYHSYLVSVVNEANVVALSLDYRLAPENLLPAAYDDAWATLKWVASHADGCGAEAWLNDHADLQRVFVAGDSAGGNISANTVAQAGVEELPGLKIRGLCLINPDFASKEGEVYRSWTFAYPSSTGGDDPRMNPAKDSRLASLGCSKVLVCVAGDDPMKERGYYYYDTLKKSGWNGDLEVVETPGESHVFHLFNPTCENALVLLRKVAAFMN